MKKWVVEDWGFELTAIEGTADNCRLGMEKDDKFAFSYECPNGMCPRVMIELFTWCPCKSIKFHLKAIPINRDENGDVFPSHPNSNN